MGGSSSINTEIGHVILYCLDGIMLNIRSQVNENVTDKKCGFYIYIYIYIYILEEGSVLVVCAPCIYSNGREVQVIGDVKDVLWEDIQLYYGMTVRELFDLEEEIPKLDV